MAPDPFQGLFDREELLGGLPARRANALLFLIESRTAHLVARFRRAVERFLTEEAGQERALAFLRAFALGRDPPLRPTIQDLERHSPAWAQLVAKNSRVQAAVAHRLGQKYEFTHEAVPGVRSALGLDEPEVRQAYEYLHREPLENIFADRARISDRLRWLWSALADRLERLSPFWTAYSLTLTEIVGATIRKTSGATTNAVVGAGDAAGRTCELTLLQRTSGSRLCSSSARLLCSPRHAGYVPGRSRRTHVLASVSSMVAVASVGWASAARSALSSRPMTRSLVSGNRWPYGLAAVRRTGSLC